jgi:hypothetical protein
MVSLATTKVKTRNDCDEKQKIFLTALESPECATQPRSQRWRWCADQAGYPASTPISDIIAPISGLIKEVSENILTRASVEAAWTISEAAGDGLIDAQTKDRIAASRDILDRVVPKKAEDTGKGSGPIAVLVLPAKQETIKLVNMTHEDLSTIKEG